MNAAYHPAWCDPVRCVRLDDTAIHRALLVHTDAVAVEVEQVCDRPLLAYLETTGDRLTPVTPAELARMGAALLEAAAKLARSTLVAP